MYKATQTVVAIVPFIASYCMAVIYIFNAELKCDPKKHSYMYLDTFSSHF